MQVEQTLEETSASESDMSWIDVAVQHGGRNAVIIDCADGWKDYLSEFYIEDCVETSVVLPAQAGLYRWSGFNVGYWGEDELCQINGGTFARFEAALPPSGIAEMWQPMGTLQYAKSGRVDLWIVRLSSSGKSHDERRAPDCYWDTRKGKWCSRWKDGNGYPAVEKHYTATHWMPAPDGPPADLSNKGVG